MKVIVQRVKEASVTSGDYYASIGSGLMLLVGIGEDTTESDIKAVSEKIAKARIFEDDAGKMNLSVTDIKGEILSISQFTLYADVKKGNRPSFTKAAAPERALALYEAFNESLRTHHITVKEGKFGEMMDIGLINDGPVTVIYESHEGKVQ